MSGYIGNVPTPQATQTRQSFTATAAQTTFNTLGYSPGYLDVYLNGVHLLDGTDYTATNGSDIVLTTGAALNDVVEFVAYSTYEVNSQNYTGGLTVDNDSATVLTVDRATSEGAIIDVQKDGTSVGTIGTRYSDLMLGTAATGLRFYDQFNAVTPWNMTTNDTRDGVISLGQSGDRFKDLYLEGGVYLGGTGAANKLDDYEEGTWTPTFISTGSGPSSITGLTVDEAVYTKTGNFVKLRARISFDRAVEAGFAVGNYFDLGGLPFTANVMGTGGLLGAIGTCHIYESLGTNSNAWGFVSLNTSSTYWLFLQTLNGGPDTGDAVHLDMSYTT